MKLKHKVLIVIVITAIIMFPVSATTGISYYTLLLTSLMLITIGTIFAVFKGITQAIEDK